MAWRHFQMSEFVCRCGCQQNYIDDQFVDLLDELRDQLGFGLKVTSGYRCPDHNDKVSSTGRSGPHTTGKAADLSVDRWRAYMLLQKAFEMGFTGIGVNQKGDGRFIHLDTLEDGRPTTWSY